MNNQEYRVHAWLKGVGYYAAEVEQLRDEIRYLQDLTQEKDLSADRVQNSGVGNPTEQTALKVIALRERLSQRIDELLDYRMEAMRVMEMAKLTPEEENAIKRYYLFRGNRRPTWEMVAEEMDYTVRAIYMIRTKALRKIAKAAEAESVHCFSVLL